MRPATSPRVAREVGLGLLQARDHRVGVLDQPPAGGVGEPETRRPIALEQRIPASRSSAASSLGDRRGRVGERLGDRGDRAAGGELAQQPEAMDVEHRHRPPLQKLVARVVGA